MHLSENEGIEGKVFVVTGGAGFVGSALCLELLRRGARQVRTLDPRTDSPWVLNLRNRGVICMPGDITQKADVERAIRGADCVFHLASYGMSGKETLLVKRIDEVNINGTCHILDTCLDFGVKRLVYLSSQNVVFNGVEILNGDESLDYIPIDKHVDPYSRSKSVAEQLILKSSGRHSKKHGTTLYTSAIRAAAIYGPGEERHLPRILAIAEMGFLTFKVGKDAVRTDWVYVDNLVLALILASMGLLDDNVTNGGRPIASGQAYFVSDGEPVNPYDFLRPLFQALHYDFPQHTMNLSLALVVAHMVMVIYTILSPWLRNPWIPQPLLLPSEIYWISVTHYFSIDKVKKELGFVPLVSAQEGMLKTTAYWKEKKRTMVNGPSIYAWLFCIIGIPAVLSAAFLSYLGPFEWIRSLCLLIFRSMFALKLVAVLSVALHIVEALYAWYLASKVDPTNVSAWVRQTLLLGVFSLRFLLKKQNM